MKPANYLLLLVLVTGNSHAQGLPQPMPSQQQQASVDAHLANPYYPQTAAPAPQAQPATAPGSEPRPWEYGQSVMTDIRQMNF